MELTDTSLNAINSRIINFNYGIDQRDKPPAISQKHMVQKNIIFYASEMMTLIKYFPLLFSDMIAEDTAVWKLFLTLRQILDYLHSQSLQVEMKLQPIRFSKELLWKIVYITWNKRQRMQLMWLQPSLRSGSKLHTHCNRCVSPLLM